MALIDFYPDAIPSGSPDTHSTCKGCLYSAERLSDTEWCALKLLYPLKHILKDQTVGYSYISFLCGHGTEDSNIQLVHAVTGEPVDAKALYDLYKLQYNEKVLTSGLVGATVKY